MLVSSDLATRQDCFSYLTGGLKLQLMKSAFLIKQCIKTSNWEIIQDAYLIDIHGQKFICLVVDEEYKPKSRSRRITKLNEAIGAQSLNISLGQVKINPHKLLEFILLMRAATNPDKENLIHKALTV